MFWKKTIIFGALLSALFFSGPAQAANELVPEFNPLCWREQQCIDIRKSLFGANDIDAKLGWYNKEAPCAGDWGRCLPAGQTVTQIALGGQVTFVNLGDYIQKVYNYAVGVAGILAVIMIVVSGAQWIASGGNSEVITSAKKRITGSVIGLVIAYLSFFILNTINPALTQFRLPQVWLVRPQALTPEFCGDLSNTTTMFSFAARNGDKNNADVSKLTFDKNWTYLTGQNCGDRFYIGGSSAAVCVASKCEDKAKPLCAPDTKSGKEKYYSCTDSVIVGKATGGYMFEPGCTSKVILGYKGFVFPFINSVSYGVLRAVCLDKTGTPSLGWTGGNLILNKDEKNKAMNFEVKLTPAQLEYLNSNNGNGACQSVKDSKLNGFYIALELNKACSPAQSHLFGVGGKHIGDSTGYISPAELSDKNLFQLIDLQRGVSMFIDVASVPVYSNCLFWCSK